jgi:indole-3-glycerol phosphate synthase
VCPHRRGQTGIAEQGAAPDLDPVELQLLRQRRPAISVLTDEHFFQGRLEHLTYIRAQVAARPAGNHQPPPPRRGLTFVQPTVYEARRRRDALLLIAAVLSNDELSTAVADPRAGMVALVEVHNGRLKRVLQLGPRLIGVNNRDLNDFMWT